MWALAFFGFFSTYERLVNTFDNYQLLSETRVHQHSWSSESTWTAPRHSLMQADHSDALRQISSSISCRICCRNTSATVVILWDAKSCTRNQSGTVWVMQKEQPEQLRAQHMQKCTQSQWLSAHHSQHLSVPTLWPLELVGYSSQSCRRAEIPPEIFPYFYNTGKSFSSSRCLWFGCSTFSNWVQEARNPLEAESSCLAGEQLKFKSNFELLELLNRL